MRQMSESAETQDQKCPACGVSVAVAEAEPLARVACPACGEKFRVERSFDHFELVETLGVGGMGAVYKARDTRLERFVALKLLRKELSADPAEAARLEHEARVTAAVNHPNVVQVYSAGSAHGQIYLVMELVDHGSLDDLMAQDARVPEAQVLEAGVQVARGLQAAHAKGLIHRDVKPANILFSDAQTAKIGDFGLAGAAEQKEARNEIWGTPYYVAPERLNNEAEDFRSDIYSLGATLFHALTGKPPMEGDTTSASELRELKSHPPDLREIAPEVSRETARVINRMLAPDPGNRFSSYTHLVDELSGAYRSLTGTAADAGASRRNRSLGIVVAVLFLALVGGGAFAWKKLKQASVPLAPPPVAMADGAASLQARFEEARRTLIQGKYDQAAGAFTKLAAEAADRQPLANWIRLHVGLTALLQRKPGPARDAFQLVERGGQFSKEKNDADLARFFVEIGRTMATAGPVRAGAAPALNPKSADAFALFLIGIKNWQLGEFAEAAGFLEKFDGSEPPNESKWIGDYKPMARKFIEDHRLYTAWKQSAQTLANPAELRDAIAKLKTLQGKLQTRGPLLDSLKDEEKRLTNEVAAREKTEKETREKAKEEQERERKRAFAAEMPRYLSEWKKRLIADLKTGAFTGKVTILGTEYQGVATAADSEIRLRVGRYGDAPFSWDKFLPETLLGMSTSFIKPDSAEAADRQWLAGVYANSSGQMKEAKALADAAAKAKPDPYAGLRDLLLSGQP